jgi:hypothetical protein
MEEAILSQLQDSFKQLHQMAEHIEELERQEKEKSQSTTIEIIEDTAAEKPTEAPTETPTETPAETPADAPTETPTETPADAPTEVGAESNVDESPISFLEDKRLRVADLPFTIDESKNADDKSANVEITSIPVALIDLKPSEIMTSASAIVSSLLETQYPVLPGEAVRMKNEKSYVSIYRKSVSEVLFTWVTYPTQNERKAAEAESQTQVQTKLPSYAVLIEKGIQCANVIFKCTKSDQNTMTFEFNSESVEGWSDNMSSAVTSMVGKFFSLNKRSQCGQLVGKKAYMSLTRMSGDEVLFTWITYPRAVSSEIVTPN